jgi:hypothetical protein
VAGGDVPGQEDALILFSNPEELAAHLSAAGWVVTATQVGGVTVVEWTEPEDRLTWLLERAACIAAKENSPAQRGIREALESVRREK